MRILRDAGQVLSRVKQAGQVLFKQASVFDPVIMQMLLEHQTEGNYIGKQHNSDSYIKQGYRYNADLYSIINKIGDDLADIPVKLVNEDEEGEQEEIKSHPLIDIIRKPNPQMSGKEYDKTQYKFFLATGNLFENGVGPDAGVNAGRFMELYPMPPQFTEIITGGWRDPVKAYTLRWAQQRHEIPAKDVSHMRMFNPNYEMGEFLRGMSPVEAAAMAIASSNSGYNAKKNKFINGGFEGFVSGADDNVNTINFSPEQRRALSKFIQDKHSGQNSGKIYITDAKAKWNAVGISLVDLAVLDSIEADLRTLCRIYQVDSKLFNDTKGSTFNNLLEAEKAYYTHRIVPLVNERTEERNNWLVKPWGENLKLVPDFSGIEVLQKDLNKMAETLTKVWMLPPNKFLEKMGFDPVDDPRFDEPWIRPGMIPLSEMNFDPFGTGSETASEEAEKAIKELMKMYA